MSVLIIIVMVKITMSAFIQYYSDEVWISLHVFNWYETILCYGVIFGNQCKRWSPYVGDEYVLAHRSEKTVGPIIAENLRSNCGIKHE